MAPIRDIVSLIHHPGQLMIASIHPTRHNLLGGQGQGTSYQVRVHLSSPQMCASLSERGVSLTGQGRGTGTAWASALGTDPVREGEGPGTAIVHPVRLSALE